jgi:hypothetical protein
MPVQLEVIKTETIKPVVGSLSLAAVFCVLVVVPFFSACIAGRRVKSSAVALLLHASVLLCVFGVAAIVQSVFKPGWVFDLSSFAGVACYAVLASLQFAILASGGGKDGKSKNLARARILLYACSFIALFTPYRGFGLAFIIGSLVNDLLATPVYVKRLRS